MRIALVTSHIGSAHYGIEVAELARALTRHQHEAASPLGIANGDNLRGPSRNIVS